MTGYLQAYLRALGECFFLEAEFLPSPGGQITNPSGIQAFAVTIQIEAGSGTVCPLA